MEEGMEPLHRLKLQLLLLLHRLKLLLLLLLLLLMLLLLLLWPAELCRFCCQPDHLKGGHGAAAAAAHAFKLLDYDAAAVADFAADLTIMEEGMELLLQMRCCVTTLLLLLPCFSADFAADLTIMELLLQMHCCDTSMLLLLPLWITLLCRLCCRPDHHGLAACRCSSVL
jgi:hypothetical protein